MNVSAMDAIDREILGVLRENARASFREIGERVGLSANAAAERVRRLERSGVISGYKAIVDPAAGGPKLTALIDVRLADPSHAEALEKLVGEIDAVVEGSHVTGRFDYQFRVACRDAAELDLTIRRMKSGGAVVESDTRLVLRSL